MKNYIVLLLIVAVSFVVAQEKHSEFTFTPQTPRVGETISITYIPVESGTLSKEVSGTICEVLINRDTLDPLLIETPLKKDGDRWMGSFVLQDPSSRFIAFRIVSGDITDDNGGMLWTSFVYGGTKKPVKGAHLAAGMLWKDGRFYTFKRTSNLDSAKAELEKEKKLYSPAWEATLGLWDLSFKKNPHDPKIKKELDAALTKYKKDEEKLSTIIQWYDKLGDSVKSSSLRSGEILRNPQGRVALQLRQSEIVAVTDKAVRAEKIESLLRNFPGMPNRIKQSYLQTLFSLYRSLKEYDKAAESLSRLEKPTGDMYNAIAWPLIENGEQLDKAVAWAKKAVELSKQTSVSEKPSYTRMKDWQENNTYLLTMVLDTYGSGLLKQGNIDEAIQYFTEAYDSTKGSEPDINTHYLDALLKGKKYDTILDVGLNCVRQAKDSPEMVAMMKDAYAKNIGSGKQYDSLDTSSKNEFEQRLSDAQKIRRNTIVTKLNESRISVPATDFTLKNFQGAPVTLSTLRGKVLIVDFWATWCGPCKMSFPFLQKVYEKYQKNENVVFLVVNTWERQSDYDAQVANAKKFIEDNKYTFPVLIDEKKDDQYDVVSRYDVEGIPTKFIIDKKGNTAWKVVGFDNGQAMIDEMTEEIDLLLSE